MEMEITKERIYFHLILMILFQRNNQILNNNKDLINYNYNYHHHYLIKAKLHHQDLNNKQLQNHFILNL